MAHEFTSDTTSINEMIDARARMLLDRAAAAERAASLSLPSDDPLDENRWHRTTATRAELLAQPEVVAQNWVQNLEALRTAATRIAAFSPERVFLTGAGDSLAVAAAAQYGFQDMFGVPCVPVQSLELAYFHTADISATSLVVALSSSGETTRTVEAMIVARSAGALTLAVTNQPASTLAREATDVLAVHATRVGWPTQSSTAALGLLLRLAALVGAERAVPAAAGLLAELNTLPELMRRTIAVADPATEQQAAEEASGRMYVFTGAGPQHACAVVGAAKLKECTPDHALAVELEEFHHYNSVKAGEPVWLFAPSGRIVQRALDTVGEAHRLGGHVHVITTEGEHLFDDVARSVLRLPVASVALSPMLYFLPAQLIGYHVAVAKYAAARSALGTEAERPR